MNYRIDFEQYQKHFCLPTKVLEALPEANEVALKVMLTLYAAPDKQYSVSLLCRILQRDKQDVEEALSFWIAKKLLVSTEPPVKQADTIVAMMPPVGVSATATVATATAMPATQSTVTQATTALQATPRVEILENEQAVSSPPLTKADDAELRFLMEQMPAILGRTVSSSDIKTMTTLFEQYRLPADLLLMAIQYAVKRGHSDMRYIEKVCVSWYDKEIRTHDDAERYLAEAAKQRTLEEQVKRILGIDRRLIPKEEAAIQRWLFEYQSTLEMITRAFEKTIEHTNQVAFPYLDKILHNWHELGCRSLDDVDNKDTMRFPPKGLGGMGGESFSCDVDALEKLWTNLPQLK